MKNTLLFHALLLSTIAVSAFTGYSYHGLQVQKELDQVVSWNTKQIQSLGVASTVQTANADYILQILNVLEDREGKPVEFGKVPSSKEPEEVPVTFEQVNKDQREVDLGIRAFASNELFQAEALDNILSILKGKEDEVNPTHKFAAQN